MHWPLYNNLYINNKEHLFTDIYVTYWWTHRQFVQNTLSCLHYTAGEMSSRCYSNHIGSSNERDKLSFIYLWHDIFLLTKIFTDWHWIGEKSTYHVYILDFFYQKSSTGKTSKLFTSLTIYLRFDGLPGVLCIFINFLV